MSVFDPRVIPCPPENQADALAILYQRVSEPLRDHLVSQVITEARRGEVDLSGLWVARECDGRLTGALLTQTLAGRAAAVWAPEVTRSWGRGALAAELVRTALFNLKVRGFRLAQAVLDETAGLRARRDLTRGGMPWVTHLLYYERTTTTPLPWRDLDLGEGRGRLDPILEWRPFEPAIEAEFVRVLLSTYTDSRDMPELSGTRGPDDILEGHRAAGRFIPERWQLGRVHGDPDSAAVLLLASHPDRDAWEVVYLGLTPRARGKGLGRAVLRHALDLARGAVARIELAADERNQPAVRLYQGAGFELRERRAVHLAILDGET